MTNTTNSHNVYNKGVLMIIILLIILGFMIKLPRSFRNYDKELHALFYFYASFGCNLIWAKNKVARYMLGVLALIAFGVGIEMAQEASNHFFSKKIHGNFDLQDIKYNILGIGIYSSLFIANYIYLKKNIDF